MKNESSNIGVKDAEDVEGDDILLILGVTSKMNKISFSIFFQLVD